MKRVQGNADVALLECTNPVRNKWRVRWDVTTDESGITSYMEEQFNHRPSTDEIKVLINEWIDERTKEAILSGFRFEGNLVWLSIENQTNYERDYLKAHFNLPDALPVTFKFGTDEQPVYRTFKSKEDIEEFYRGYTSHIRQTQLDGWNAKDAVDLELYYVN